MLHVLASFDSKQTLMWIWARKLDLMKMVPHCCPMFCKGVAWDMCMSMMQGWGLKADCLYPNNWYKIILVSMNRIWMKTGWQLTHISSHQGTVIFNHNQTGVGDGQRFRNGWDAVGQSHGYLLSPNVLKFYRSCTLHTMVGIHCLVLGKLAIFYFAPHLFIHVNVVSTVILTVEFINKL